MPLRESPQFLRCILRSLPRPNHLQDLPPLTQLRNSPPAPSSITFYATMLFAQAHPTANATPFTTTTAQDTELRPLALWLAELPDFPSVMDSVTRVVGSPRVFDLRTNSSLYAQVKQTSATLIDSGANICLTGDLTLLVNVVEITPLPISVTINGEEPHINDSCTCRGYLPLNLLDGGVHIGSSASIAKTRLRQSSPHRQFWRQVTCLLCGCRPDSSATYPLLPR
jgi:hypothetical protein